MAKAKTKAKAEEFKMPEFHNPTGPASGELVPAAPENNPQLLKMGELADVARRYGRNVAECFDEAKHMIAIDKEAAKNCGYALPRGGKDITGPSVRLAEIVQHAWGNIMISTDNFEVIRDQETGAVKVKVTGYGIDLQKNNGVAIFEVRKVQPKRGKGVDDDMIDLTVRQTKAVVYREIMFKLIPKLYVNSLYEYAIGVSLGSNNHEERVEKMFDGYSKEFGVSEEEILSYLQKPSKDNVTPEDIRELIGLTTEMRENRATADEIFRAREGEEESSEQESLV